MVNGEISNFKKHSSGHLYFSLKDDLLDNDKAKDEQKLLKLESYISQLKEKYQRQYNCLSENLQKIVALEKIDEDNIVTLSTLSGEMIKEIFAPKEDIFYKQLTSIGKSLGSFIYIMDAFDDLKKDIKNGSFNPLKKLSKKENFNETVKDLLELPLSQAASSLERLPLDDNLSILRNIIYSGVWSRFEVLTR